MLPFKIVCGRDFYLPIIADAEDDTPWPSPLQVLVTAEQEL
jgi:hypothetical protein